MGSKFDWSTKEFYYGTLKEFIWTKKIKSVNEINFWRQLLILKQKLKIIMLNKL